jgi:uncharacterized protein YjbI with pentapeptide repeats
MCACGGECLPIETLVRQAFAQHDHGSVAIIGPAGSGKTTALQHLAVAASANDLPLVLLDEPTVYEVDAASHRARVVYTSRDATRGNVLVALEPAGWDDDDAIEYLLAVHHDRCASVMSRLMRDERRMMLGGSPELWHIVLDEMAADESIAGSAEALCRHLDRLLVEERLLDAVGLLSLTALRDKAAKIESLIGTGDEARAMAVPDVARLMRHRAVQLLLAADRVTWNLSRGERYDDLTMMLPRDLVNEIARRVRHRPAALDTLRGLGAEHHGGRITATAASILVAADPAWTAIATAPLLTGAFLTGAQWAGVDLSRADLSAADFTRADLTGANLLDASASVAIFLRAVLRNANLRQLDAPNADFTAADLVGVRADRAVFDNASLDSTDLSSAGLCRAKFIATNLCRSKLTGANLRGAILDHARIDGCDLRGANLTSAKCAGLRFTDAELDGADFTRAVLRDCVFEGIDLPSARFRRANLSGSDLTASRMPDADFRRARLVNCGLANIDWQNADLRGVDFTGASFHLGSTRSGLVGSVIPCEGSRTGFYTDEYDEQDFKSPEEIRKANLCGADLRGAKVDGIDWYLVDLRGAKYSSSQAEHFAQCGAILRDVDT